MLNKVIFTTVIGLIIYFKGDSAGSFVPPSLKIDNDNVINNYKVDIFRNIDSIRCQDYLTDSQRIGIDNLSNFVNEKLKK